MKSVLHAGVILGMLAFSSVSLAEESPPSAEDIKAAAEEFDLGRRSFKARDYVEAAEHFEVADQNAPSAAALELAIRARDRAGQLERAATLAALAEKRHPDEAALKTLAEGILKRARAELHEASVKCSTACDLMVDNKILHGRSATEWTVFFEPGPHQVRAGWPGDRSVDEEIAAQRAGSSETSFEEPPEEKRGPAVAGSGGPGTVRSESGELVSTPSDQGVVERPKGWSPAVFFTGVGLTAVLGGLTVWSGIDTVNNPGTDKVKRDCQGQGTDCPTYQDGLDKQRRTNILGAATGVVGVATIVVGLLATDWSSKPASQVASKARRAQNSRTHIEPWLGINSGATVGAAGRF
jgi:hypothetical protein